MKQDGSRSRPLSPHPCPCPPVRVYHLHPLSAFTIHIHRPHLLPSASTTGVHHLRPHTRTPTRAHYLYPAFASTVYIHCLHPLTLTPIYHRQARKKAAQAISKANRKTRAAARNATHAAAALPDSEHAHPDMSAPPLTAHQARKKAAQDISKANRKARATTRNATHAAAALPDSKHSQTAMSVPSDREQQMRPSATDPSDFTSDYLSGACRPHIDPLQVKLSTNVQV